MHGGRPPCGGRDGRPKAQASYHSPFPINLTNRSDLIGAPSPRLAKLQAGIKNRRIECMFDSRRRSSGAPYQKFETVSGQSASRLTLIIQQLRLVIRTQNLTNAGLDVNFVRQKHGRKCARGPQSVPPRSSEWVFEYHTRQRLCQKSNDTTTPEGCDVYSGRIGTRPHPRGVPS
jgi:hypothetical protein